jgi:hypothetical protein
LCGYQAFALMPLRRCHAVKGMRMLLLCQAQKPVEVETLFQQRLVDIVVLIVVLGG